MHDDHENVQLPADHGRPARDSNASKDGEDARLADDLTEHEEPAAEPAQPANDFPETNAKPKPEVRRQTRRTRESQLAWEVKRKYWASLLAEWQAGHLTQVEFCDRKGEKIGTFQKWRRRFRDELTASSGTEPDKVIRPRRRRHFTRPVEVGFVELIACGEDGQQPMPAVSRTSVADSVSVDESPAQCVAASVGAASIAHTDRPSNHIAPYEIIFPRGLSLRLSQDFDSQRVEDLLKAISTSC